MMRLLLLSFALATPALAQAPAAPAPAATTAPVEDLVRVTLTTAEGPIVLALDRGRAPKTVANFLRYVDAKRFDGTAFYRAMKIGDGLGLVQFGTSNDPKRTYPPIAHEPTTQTGLTHTDGAISMAMAAPGTAAGDIFIIVGDLHTLDATAQSPGFAAFGKVVEGMDVVRRILAAPTSPTEGEGVMRGQMLEPTIKVQTIRRD
ncbi:peptidylprolyl isomerase [Sphingomonas sp.]|uniref:peptidylprolyl isomerase n=1 Tax=Sphingomonas sp. TaxID=28214 RepID=UPI0035C7E1C5